MQTACFMSDEADGGLAPDLTYAAVKFQGKHRGGRRECCRLLSVAFGAHGPLQEFAICNDSSSRSFSSVDRVVPYTLLFSFLPVLAVTVQTPAENRTYKSNSGFQQESSFEFEEVQR